MIGFRFRFEQRGAVHLAFRIKLADAGLFVIGQARRHGPGGDEDGG